MKAIKAVEDSKNLEIEALKIEIEQLKSGAPAIVVPMAIGAVTPSDLEHKLASYQAFMTEYVVNAQNQKLLAVKEAELKAEKKFAERLETLSKASELELPHPEPGTKMDRGGGGNAALSPASGKETLNEKPVAAKESGGAAISSAPPVTLLPSLKDLANLAGSSSFQSRNAYIIRAAAAGKSRWGTKEIVKATEDIQRATPPTVSSLNDPKDASSPFEQRNGQVVAAAEAGKSRWGNMEVERLKKNGMVTEIAAVAKDEKKGEDARSGDRVNLGARLLEKFMDGGK